MHVRVRVSGGLLAGVAVAVIVSVIMIMIMIMRVIMIVLVVMVLAVVLVGVEVDVQAFLRRFAGSDHLDPAVLDAAGREDLLGKPPQLVRGPLQDDHLEAVHLVEVHMHGRPHLAAELMLERGQSLGEIAHVVVVDQRDRGDGIAPAGHLRPGDLRPGQIPQDLGPGAGPPFDQRIKGAEQRGLHRDPETHQAVSLHHARILQGLPSRWPPVNAWSIPRA